MRLPRKTEGRIIINNGMILRIRHMGMKERERERERESHHAGWKAHPSITSLPAGHAPKMLSPDLQ